MKVRRMVMETREIGMKRTKSWRIFISEFYNDLLERIIQLHLQEIE